MKHFLKNHPALTGTPPVKGNETADSSENRNIPRSKKSGDSSQNGKERRKYAHAKLAKPAKKKSRKERIRVQKKEKNCIDKEDMQDKVSEKISLNAFNSRLRAFA